MFYSDLKKFLVLFLLTLFGLKLFAISSNNDSLQRIINAMPNDTNKVNSLLGYMYYYQTSSKETAINIGHQALYLSKTIKWPLGKAKIKKKIGRIYWDWGKYDSALHYHYIAAWQFNKLNLWKDYWDVIVMIGQDYANSTQYDKALFYFNASLNEYKIKKVEGGVTYVLAMIAWVHNAKGDYTKASQINFEQLKICEKNGDSAAMLNAYGSLISNYMQLRKYNEAEKISDDWYPYIKRNNVLYELLDYNVRKAIFSTNRNRIDSGFYFYEKEKEIAFLLKNDYWIADAFLSIGNLYMNRQNYMKALHNFDSAYYYFKSYNQNKELAFVNCRRTLCLLHLGNIKQAKIAIDEAQFFLKTIQSKSSNLEYYNAKYKYDSASNNWPSAFIYLNLFETLKDSIYNEENTQQLLELQIRHETDKRENLLKEKNRNMNMYLIILAVFSFIAVLFFVLLYFKNKKIKKANLIQSTMLNEIHHRVKNNLQLISGFMQLQLGKTNDTKGRDALEESINNINVVALVHENLYQQSSDLVKLDTYIPNLCANFSSLIKSINLPQINIDCDEIKLSIDQSIPIGLILNELITNSVKYAFIDNKKEKNIIDIKISQKGKIIRFHYDDNGIGFKETPENKSSIGLKLIKMLVQELQGNYTINGKNKFEFDLTFNIKNARKL